MRKWTVVGLVGSVLLAMAGVGNSGPLSDATADSLWGIQLGGYLDVSYSYNFNDPNDPNHGIGGHALSDDDNQIQLEAFQLYVDKLPQDAGEVGFRFDILAGETAEWFPDLFGGYTNDINIYQAFISYIAPIGNGLTIDIGHFAAGSGYESIENPRNDQFSHGFLFSLMQPWTTTGVRLTYAINDQWELSGGLLQGLDVVEDNNEAWTFNGAIRWMPVETVFIQNTVYYGPENTNYGWVDGNLNGIVEDTELTWGIESNDDYSLINNLTASWDINESWTVRGEFDYVSNENALPTPTSVKDAESWGLAGYLRYNVNPSLYVALRGEWFLDCDNMIFFGRFDKTDHTLWEVTATLGYTLTEGLLTRLEYRHDGAEENVFRNEDGRDDRQDTISMEVIYSF